MEKEIIITDESGLKWREMLDKITIRQHELLRKEIEIQKKQKFYNLLKEFYNERNNIVLSSRIRTDLDKDIANYLTKNNMKSNDKGTIYLGELIKLLYHERELYNKIDCDQFNYFNLDDCSNIHYKYLDDKAPELVISEIIKTIVNSSEEQIKISINDIVYNGVNEICSYRYKRHLKKYKK